MSASDALLSARYIAIRTAEAKGLTNRLLEASRDKTPGVRKLLVPLLYRFWHNDRAKGFSLLEQIASGVVRFPSRIDRDAIEILGEVSMPILNASRENPEDLARLNAIWRDCMSRLLGSPILRSARIIFPTFVLRLLTNRFSGVLKRQPIYQPVNYQEAAVSFGRLDEFRKAWRSALDCLEHPERGLSAIEDILMLRETPFDLYLMMVCERALIVHGARTDPAGALDLCERIFHQGCPWFRGPILYALFHIFSYCKDVEDAWLERYEALSREFFISGAWRLKTSAQEYRMPGHAANADVVSARHRPDRPPQVVPALLKFAIDRGDKYEIEAVFSAIDGVAFFHGSGALALAMIEVAHTLGGPPIEPRIIASLASVRVLNQPLVDAVLDRGRVFGRISPSDVAGAQPSVTEEDLLTLVDGFMVYMMVTSDSFRAEICGAFRRALTARSAEEFVVQILDWVRDLIGAAKRG